MVDVEAYQHMPTFTDKLRIVKTNLGRESAKAVRKILAPKGVRELPPKYPQDFNNFTRKLWDQIEPYTMTSQARVANLEYATRYIATHNIPGDFVECGVGAGGSMMAVALTLLDEKISERRLLLYDTYEGMAKPTDKDVSVFGKPATRKWEKKTRDGNCTWHNFPLEDVQANLALTRYPSSKLEFHKGFVQDTLPHNDSDAIALLRLDTNLYESTVAECKHLFPKLQRGGVLIIDDYYRWLGQKEAVDEYLAENDIPMLLMRIDDHSAMGIKP
ncbi:MAG: TylF/MycF/NovP-related O-methyltransferase [Pseudomonadota bacterium]